MITQSQAISLFVYNPSNGWINNRVHRRASRAGTRAGTDRPDGYRQIRVNGYFYLEHRLIWLMMYGNWPKEQIDHKDGDKTNNRLSNLREATHSQNRMNRERDSGTSGLRGVSPNKSATGWRARVWVDGQEVSLGEYATKEEASFAYLKAAELQYGEFAFHNRPQPFERRI